MKGPLKIKKRTRTYALRTRIKRDILCEFMPPAKTGRQKPNSNKIIILCGGMPGYPGKSSVPGFLSEKGFWVFVPRYRGSWESGGSFLRISPHRDVIDVIDALPRGFTDLWSGKTYRIARPEIYIIGASFGGPAAILASRDPRVRKAVALSPVTDWRVESKAEPIDKLGTFARAAFGEGYRGAKRDWDKLKTGRFYNPMHEAKTVDGGKLFIIHPKDDEVVYAKTSETFSKITGARIVLPKRGGHLGASGIMVPDIWPAIRKFLR